MQCTLALQETPRLSEGQRGRSYQETCSGPAASGSAASAASSSVMSAAISGRGRTS